MTIYVDVAIKSKRQAVFRAIAQELLDLEHSDWNGWEWNWLHSMLRYPKAHKYTEAERLKLDQLCWLSEPFTGHDGLTVEQMIATCYRYHLDFGEDDSDFIVKLLTGTRNRYEDVSYGSLSDFVDNQAKTLRQRSRKSRSAPGATAGRLFAAQAKRQNRYYLGFPSLACR